MDTTTDTLETTDAPARSVRVAHGRVRAPRAGSITGHLLRGIATYDMSARGGASSRYLVQYLARVGITYPLRAVAATLAIMRTRGAILSQPMPGAEHGQNIYFLTEKGGAMLALMGEAAPVPQAAGETGGAPSVA